MNVYVLGFLFSKQFSRVMLIKKAKPEWQAGKLNGVGGKVEDTDPTFSAAMEREFMEETGIHVPADDWTRVCAIRFDYDKEDGADVHVFAAVGDWNTMVPRRDLPEKAGWFFWDANTERPIIPNLRWMVPLARSAVDGSGVREVFRLVTPEKYEPES